MDEKTLLENYTCIRAAGEWSTLIASLLLCSLKEEMTVFMNTEERFLIQNLPDLRALLIHN